MPANHSVRPSPCGWQRSSDRRRQRPAAAVVDCELPDGDVMLLAEVLSKKGIPFVIQSTAAVTPEIAMICLGVPVLTKPIQPQDVVSILAHEVIKAETNP